ncbi:internalin C2 [Candidatus Magnetoovum chiemensis]|nr:internalin C2 [Candidatus Magnetoovum chiemensis]
MKVCPYCGQSLQLTVCPKCGVEAPANARFCPQGCGNLNQLRLDRLTQREPLNEEPKKLFERNERSRWKGCLFTLFAFFLMLSLFIINYTPLFEELENKKFEKVRAVNTISAWEEYIKAHPIGARYEESLMYLNSRKAAFLAEVNAVLERPFKSYEELYSADALIGFNQDANSFPALKDLPNLRRVIVPKDREDYIKRELLTDLSPLLEAPWIEELDISRTGIVDFKGLEKLVKLKSLSLEYTAFQQTNILSGMINLQKLNIAGTQISSVKPLAGLTNLRELSLRSTRVSDITHLAGLANLQILNLENAQVTDTSSLKGIAKLTIKMD